jgi:hypothetical protein
MQHKGPMPGLNGLASNGDPSGAYFQVAAVFLHTGGTGADRYASKSTDWWWCGIIQSGRLHAI